MISVINVDGSREICQDRSVWGFVVPAYPAEQA